MAAGPADRPLLELDGISRQFAGRRVLDGLSLSVGRGEVVGLLGPNGSGKTTTLRIAAGTLWPDAGRVAVDGAALTPADPPSRRRLGFLPERVPLDDALSVRRYLELVAAARGLGGAHRTAAVARAIGDFDLAAVAGRMIGQLSKGFRQRVGLAQALLADPAVLLLDEPTSGLDPLQTVEARRLIRAAAGARAVVLSTHVIQEVEAMCTRVVYLADGRLTEVTPRGEDGDLFEAVVTGGEAGVAALLDAVGLQARELAREALGGERTRVALRPAGGAHAALAAVLADSPAVETFRRGGGLEARIRALIERGQAA
ncbi:MAG: ABC transporter ATP-binding protein [Gammaproteobacteria bacterium]